MRDALPPNAAELSAAAGLFLLGTILLFLTAPHHGEFWWSDAPRHALNGVFVKDLIAAMPAHPAAWAMQYYVKYPALTILFYPPLFYFVSAPFYALLGVSHTTALVVVLVHYFALALGVYLLARCWIGPIAAIAVGLAVMAAPGIALWGRQIMLEVPSAAFAVWAALLLRHYITDGRAGSLYLSAFLLLCATYTKITTIFLFPVFAVALLAARGPMLFRERHTWIVAGLTLVGILPLVYLTLAFGSANVQSVTGIPDAAASRASISGWIWYARQMPWQLGWPLLVLAIIGVPFAVRRVTRSDLILLGGWFLLGYLFLSAIALKEARHALVILPVALLAAGLAIDALLPARAAGPALLAVVVGTGIYTWRAAPTPSVDGYREAAEWIAREAPKDAVVAFSGKRDGLFIFNLRALPTRQDIGVLRVDKLLMDVAIRRELGVREKPLSEQEIGDLLDKDGVSYIVMQDDFWTDLPVMSRFQSVVQSEHFKEVARIPVVANVPTEDHTIIIYRNMGNVAPGPHIVDLQLPIIGRQVKGAVGR
jgi:Dolichyl-phosphate-mannose-protein mannosyltransferase